MQYKEPNRQGDFNEDFQYEDSENDVKVDVRRWEARRMALQCCVSTIPQGDRCGKEPQCL
jgi:hypothetical protein